MSFQAERRILLREKDLNWQAASKLGEISKDHISAALTQLGDTVGSSLVDLKEENYRDISLAIVHGADEVSDLKSLFERGCLPNLLIVLEVSGGGKSRVEDLDSDKWDSGTKSAWFLPVRNHEPLETDSDVMARVLVMNSKDAEAIHKGQLQRLSQELRSVFFKQEPSIFLPAISILCQGFLATQAKPGGAQANEDLSESVREALKEMGWFDVADSSLLSPALRGEDQGGLTNLRTEVQSEAYWNAVAGTDGLVEKCKQEWQAPGSVDGLEKLIKSDESEDNEGLIPFSFPISNAELVAKAYLALHKRLGGK